uniref:Myosin-4 n=1 Tax=Myoviridae sp. ctRRy11 TaxID=2826651 RepID=A0A8S5MXV6_9CAUD|nr:MAG TPA: Myosin-4 [Myoviridae sp. ctRRy11]
MQKNKRYEWDKMEGCEWIRDTEMVNQPLYYDLETVASLLNRQDKRIKELEEENQQLKQSQKQLAISELEKTREKFGYKYNSQLLVSSKYLCGFINNQIKSLKGEEK